MPDLIRDGNGNITPLAQNYRKTKESSNFGTRKLAFYTFWCSQDLELAYRMVEGSPDFNQPVWQESGSLYYQIVRALQEANVELYWLGQPHNTNENFYENWDGLAPSDSDAFVFAIKDDADVPKSYLEGTEVYDATYTNDYGPNWITIDGDPDVYIGQEVVFTGNVFGGLIEGKTYYIADYDYDGTAYIKVSDYVTSTVLDEPTPEGYGTPGDVVTLTSDSGNMTTTFKYLDFYWQGTAGDIIWSCCNNPLYPYVDAWNLNDHVGNNVELSGPWSIVRCQPTWSIFPAAWSY